MSKQLQILSINVNRSLITLTALLETSTADILLTQEPYWGPLVPRRSDVNPDGTKVTGMVNHKGWEVYHPTVDGDNYPWVATFVRKEVVRSLHISTSPLLDTYYCVGITLSLPSPLPMLTLLNFYHHVSSQTPLLHALTHTTIPCDAATLICGDFNTHSMLWSPGNLRPSPWAETLEEWMDDESLVSLGPEGAITHTRGSDQPSIIDLMLANPSFLETLAFPDECSISFNLSLRSDHTGLLLAIPVSLPTPPPADRPGWKIEDGKKDEWITLFRSYPLSPMSPVNDASLRHLTQRIDEMIAETSSSLFQLPRPASHSLPWWNASCKLTVTALQGVHSNERRSAYKALCLTIRRAKRDWYKTLLNDPEVNIWDLAKWRKGRRQAWLPPIQVEGGTSSDPTQMAEAFCTHFFVSPCLDQTNPCDVTAPCPLERGSMGRGTPRLTADRNLGTHVQDIPLIGDRPEVKELLPFPSLPTRPFIAVTSHEISAALKTCANKSAPGLTGIPYKLVQWVNDARPDLLITLFNATLRLRIHPWTEAKVVVIPKPGKSDYSAPKSYCPISLLECTGKVLEKIIV
jgi:Endonuclease-reverse transcriptase